MACKIVGIYQQPHFVGGFSALAKAVGIGTGLKPFKPKSPNMDESSVHLPLKGEDQTRIPLAFQSHDAHVSSKKNVPNDGSRVGVVCNGTKGIFLVDPQMIYCGCALCVKKAGVAPMTPTEFERHSGMAASKKWRRSIKVDNGDPNLTLGKWLEGQGIHLKAHKCRLNITKSEEEECRAAIEHSSNSAQSAEKLTNVQSRHTRPRRPSLVVDGPETDLYAAVAQLGCKTPKVTCDEVANILLCLKSGPSDVEDVAKDQDEYVEKRLDEEKHPVFQSRVETSKRSNRARKVPQWLAEVMADGRSGSMPDEVADSFDDGAMCVRRSFDGNYHRSKTSSGSKKRSRDDAAGALTADAESQDLAPHCDESCKRSRLEASFGHGLGSTPSGDTEKCNPTITEWQKFGNKLAVTVCFNGSTFSGVVTTSSLRATSGRFDY